MLLTLLSRFVVVTLLGCAEKYLGYGRPSFKVQDLSLWLTSIESMIMNLGWPEGLWYGLMIFWFDSRLLGVRSRQCVLLCIQVLA